MSIRSLLNSKESEDSVLDLDLDHVMFKNRRNFVKSMNFDEENFIRKLTFEQR